METILIAISCFLGGSFLTAIGFIFGFSNKISVMQSTLEGLDKSFYEHTKAPQVTCTLHSQMLVDVERLKERVYGRPD